MTSIIGIVCQDAVVIGADSSATSSAAQTPIMEQPITKIHDCNNRFILAGTGSLGLDQRFESILKKYNPGKNDSAVKVACTLSAQAIQDFERTGLYPRNIHSPGSIEYGCLLGFFAENCPYLCEYEIGKFQPEFKTSEQWFVSMGSGQFITDPFLALLKSVFWQKTRPNEHEAVFAITWALQHVIEINPGGINGPINIKILRRTEALYPTVISLGEEDLYEHTQNIEECKQALREIRDKHKSPTQSIPEVPKP